MKDRHDAMAAAAAIACEVERLVCATGSDTRGTVGYIETHPGEHNIIAEKCVIPVDFREAESKRLEKLYKDLMFFTEKQCKDRGLTFSVYNTIDLKPAHCAPELISLIDRAANALSIPHSRMISFPAHDAMNLSRIMPTGMIFLRSSNGGVSHCPEEFTTKEDLSAGAHILANTLYAAASEEIF